MGKPDQPRNPDGTWKARNSWGLAGLLALTLTVGAGAGGVGAGGAATALGGGDTVAGRSLNGSQGRGTQARARARTRSTARATRAVERLRGRGLRVEERGTRVDVDCAARSYGQVQGFFRQHPCLALYRTLLVVRDGPVTMVIAVAAVDMPDDAQAVDLKQLVDRSGTGNLTERTKEGVRPTLVQWTGEHYASAQDETTFVNVQAEPVGRTAQAIRLARLAADTAVS